MIRRMQHLRGASSIAAAAALAAAAAGYAHVLAAPPAFAAAV